MLLVLVRARLVIVTLRERALFFLRENAEVLRFAQDDKNVRMKAG
jgi:hypothetical protein